MLSSLARSVDLVVNDQFPICRYEDQTSVHRRTIFETRPEVKEERMRGISKPLSSFLVRATDDAAQVNRDILILRSCC